MELATQASRALNLDDEARDHSRSQRWTVGTPTATDSSQRLPLADAASSPFIREGRFRCPWCDWETQYANGLMIHASRMHAGTILGDHEARGFRALGQKTCQLCGHEAMPGVHNTIQIKREPDPRRLGAVHTSSNFTTRNAPPPTMLRTTVATLLLSYLMYERKLGSAHGCDIYCDLHCPPYPPPSLPAITHSNEGAARSKTKGVAKTTKDAFKKRMAFKKKRKTLFKNGRRFLKRPCFTTR